MNNKLNKIRFKEPSDSVRELGLMINFFHPGKLIVLIVFFLSCCGTPSSPHLDFIYIHPHGFSNGRSIHFLIYEDPNKVKGFSVDDEVSSSKELKNKYLLHYLPSIIKTIDTKNAVEYRYEVIVQKNGKRKEFLLNKDWIPVIKEIRKHILHDKRKTQNIDRLLHLVNTFPDGIKVHKDAPVPGVIKE